jgi:hypothetical protein
MFATTPCVSPAVVERHAILERAAREMDALLFRLNDTIAVAGTLSAATDWKSPSATVFRLVSSEWVCQLGGLVSLLENAADAARRERDYAAFLVWGCA